MATTRYYSRRPLNRGLDELMREMKRQQAADRRAREKRPEKIPSSQDDDLVLVTMIDYR